jgi:hypothetical protein
MRAVAISERSEINLCNYIFCLGSTRRCHVNVCTIVIIRWLIFSIVEARRAQIEIMIVQFHLSFVFSEVAILLTLSQPVQTHPRSAGHGFMARTQIPKGISVNCATTITSIRDSKTSMAPSSSFSKL